MNIYTDEAHIMRKDDEDRGAYMGEPQRFPISDSIFDFDGAPASVKALTGKVSRGVEAMEQKCDLCGEAMRPNRFGYRNYFQVGRPPYDKHVHAHCQELIDGVATATCNTPNCEVRALATVGDA